MIRTITRLREEVGGPLFLDGSGHGVVVVDVDIDAASLSHDEQRFLDALEAALLLAPSMLAHRRRLRAGGDSEALLAAALERSLEEDDALAAAAEHEADICGSAVDPELDEALDEFGALVDGPVATAAPEDEPPVDALPALHEPEPVEAEEVDTDPYRRGTLVERLLITLHEAGGAIVDPNGRSAVALLLEASGTGVTSARIRQVMPVMEDDGLIVRAMNGRWTSAITITDAGRAAIGADTAVAPGPFPGEDEPVDHDDDPLPELGPIDHDDDPLPDALPEVDGPAVDAALGVVDAPPTPTLTVDQLDEFDLDVLAVLNEGGSYSDDDRACRNLARRTSYDFDTDFIDAIGVLVTGGPVDWDQRAGENGREDRRTNRIEITAAGRAIVRGA